MAEFFFFFNEFNYPWNSWIYKKNVDFKNMDMDTYIKIIEIGGIINSSWTSVIYFTSFMDNWIRIGMCIGKSLFQYGIVRNIPKN